jgi:hypothetical protein
MDKNRQDVLLHCSIPECTSKIKPAPIPGVRPGLGRADRADGCPLGRGVEALGEPVCKPPKRGPIQAAEAAFLLALAPYLQAEAGMPPESIKTDKARSSGLRTRQEIPNAGNLTGHGGPLGAEVLNDQHSVYTS